MTIRAAFFDMGGTIETLNSTRALRLSAIPDLRRLLTSASIELDLQDDQLLDVISDGLNRYHQWRMQTLVELSPCQIWHEYVLAGYTVDPDILATP